MRYQFRTLLAAALCMIGLCVTPLVNAGPPLQKLDWKSPGDQLLLLDTNTGLTWLHLSQTLNRSANDLMSQWFGNTSILPLTGTFAGFRYATEQEVAQLYTDFGIVTMDNTFSAANWIGANVAFQALGMTDSCCSGATKVQEAMILYSPGLANAPEIVTDWNTARAYVFLGPLTNTYSFDAEKATLGSYLVMLAPVPEPSEYAMLLAGLAIVGFIARRRRQST